MEKPALCAILPSPEKLDESSCSPGSDATNTLGDFNQIRKWLEQSGLRNIEWFDQRIGQTLETSQYYPIVKFAFKDAFDPMLNTGRPDLPGLVFWYYTGLGLSKKAATKFPYSSTPCLATDGVKISPEYHEAADEFVKKFEGRKVEGGELCLHKVGFCDLYGLLKPWIAAVKAESINAKGCSKKNKHLVIILDSCYSGIIADELKKFEEYMKKKDSKFLQENSVTIQAGCGPYEVALRGYFTPCFVYLNDPKNAAFLSDLKGRWKGMNTEKRNQYAALPLPSPMVVTTLSQFKQSQDVTVGLKIHNFKLTLFRDPGFFKLCSIAVSRLQDYKLFVSKDRVLDRTPANNFMTSSTFTVLDYKLKKMVTEPYAGDPVGLFLLENPMNPGHVVCAHIHFRKGKTNNLIPQRINLVHHKKPPVGSIIYLNVQDYDRLPRHQISKNWQKYPSSVLLDRNALKLVEACRTYVESKKTGRWNNASQWNMTVSDLIVNLSLSVQEEQEQRSAREGTYLEHIRKFNIPKVADN